MEQLQLMKERHSVRQYKNDKIEKVKREKINKCISEINCNFIRLWKNTRRST